MLEDLIEPTDCPYYLVSRATLVLTSVFRKAFIAAGVGNVRPAYLGVLWCLWKKDGIKTIELSRGAGLEPSTMTGLLDRMERDGFVTRSPDPSDRRALTIHLTPHGKAIRGTVVKMVAETLDALFQGIPETDLARTNDVLRHLLANARQEVDV
jgi:DNA-binding MarR family transcriptional regulator